MTNIDTDAKTLTLEDINALDPIERLRASWNHYVSSHDKPPSDTIVDMEDVFEQMSAQSELYFVVEHLLDVASGSAGLDATGVDHLRSAFEQVKVSTRTLNVSKGRLMDAVCDLLASRTN
jgi:hypothetical protein